MFKPSAPKAAAGAARTSSGDVGDAAQPLASGWLRTKGRDNSALVAAVAGNRLQQMKSWNLWWTVLSRGVPPSAPFVLRCYADQALAQLKARLFGAQGFRAQTEASLLCRSRRSHARRMKSRWPWASPWRCWTPRRLCSARG
jgi:hypothetical protein